ncbi:MAG: sugar nucleotide-binding protein [Patescibacteria group bacterium]|jgi:dTDP-4-dehydrorhamnose reductase
MKTVAITGPTEMLGSMVYNVLKNKYNLILICDENDDFELLEKTYSHTSKHKQLKIKLHALYQDYLAGFSDKPIGVNFKKMVSEIGQIDAIINCLTITKPNLTTDPVMAFFINGCLPHVLSRFYKEKLIHITTDCVFDGLNGAPYTEDSIFNPTDFYGLTRSLGEPNKQSLVLRTSTIGPEIQGFNLFLEWFKKQEGNTIKGFTNHLWNGITTKQFGEICDKIIFDRQNYPANGLYHIFSNEVTKFEMLTKFKEKFNIKVNIEAEKSTPIDRRLATKKDLCAKLQIPSFENMLLDL